MDPHVPHTIRIQEKLMQVICVHTWNEETTVSKQYPPSSLVLLDEIREDDYRRCQDSCPHFSESLTLQKYLLSTWIHYTFLGERSKQMKIDFFFFLEWLAPPSLRLSLMITFPICYQPSENLPVPSSLFSCNRMEVLKCRSRYAFSNFTLAFTLGRNLPTVFRHPHLSS
jgi:hypothetical protein